MTAMRKPLHDLIDELPEERVGMALRILLGVRDDPVATALRHAPFDDESLTAEDEAAIDRGRADIERGETLSSEGMRRELGL